MTVFVRHWWVRFANVMNYQTREATTPFCFAKFPLLEEKEGKMGAIFLSSLLYSFIFRFSSISIFNSQPLHCLSILLLELFVHSFVTSQFFILNSPFSILNSHIVNSSILHCQFSILNSPFSTHTLSIVHCPLSIPPFSIVNCQLSILHSSFSTLHSPFSTLHSHSYPGFCGNTDLLLIISIWLCGMGKTVMCAFIPEDCKTLSARPVLTRSNHLCPSI